MKNATPDTVDSKGLRPGSLDNASAGRVMAVKPPKSAVAKGNLSPRNRAAIINGD
ncbi:MAG TPA: hypothetical protein VE309_11025 [Caulobacteraceae bacterium]|nr:hypothetical protein [Caulobacteraceae bacterium]